MKAGRAESQEELTFQFELQGRKRLMSQLREAEGVLSILFLFYLGPHLIEWGPPTLGKTICFSQSPASNVTLTWEHSHRHTYYSI